MNLLLLTLNELEENVVDKVISALADYAQLEIIQFPHVSALTFPGTGNKAAPTPGI